MTDVASQAPVPSSAPADAPAGQAPLPAEADPVLSAPTLEDNLNAVLKTAPVIGTSPGLAVGVASSGGDTQKRAQSLGRGVQSISDSRAHERVQQSAGGPISGALNWLGNHVAHYTSDVLHPIEEAGKTIGHDAMVTLNKPLSIVQHEYRYLHDVEASHGMTAAILEGLGIAAGAAAGTVAGGPWGGVLGAEAAAGVEGQVFYRDSWARTGKASYVDPHTHQPVSLGRDLVSFLNSNGIMDIRPGTKPFKVTSGLIDGLFDMSVGGPEVGELAKVTQGGERAAGLLGNYFIGTAPQTVEDVQNAYARYGSVQRAFKDLAGKTAGEIAATPAYEPLARDANFLRALGEAQTPEAVLNLFESAVQAQQLAFTRNLPTIAATRVPFQALREYAENANGVVGRIARGFTRLPDNWQTVEGRLQQISAHEFDPASTLDNGAVGLYRMLRYTESRHAATAITDAYLNAPDLESRIAIFRNAQLNTIFKMGGLEGQSRDEYLKQFLNPNHREAIGKVLDDLVGGGMFGKQAIYGLDDQGRILSLVQHTNGEWQYGAAILQNQTGKLRFLDPVEAKRAGKMLASAQSIFDNADRGVIRRTLAGGDLAGRLGDFAYHHITQGIFKPLVLLTPSYAMHISLAELIPNTLRLGVRNMVRDGIALNIAKLGDKHMVYDAAQERVAAAHDELALAEQSGVPERIAVADEKLRKVQAEAKHQGYQSMLDHALSGMAWRMLDHLSGGELADLVAHPEQLAKSAMGRRIQLAARYIEYNDGYAPSALLSGHYSPTEIGQREEVAARLMRHAVGSTPLKLGDTFRQFGSGEHGFYDAYQAWLKEIAADPASRVGARRILDEARKGSSLDVASQRAAEDVAQYLREMPEDEKGKFLRSNPGAASMTDGGQPYVTSFAGGLPAGMDQYDDWGRVIVANLRGAVRGAEGTLHVPLLDHIAQADNDFPETLWYPQAKLKALSRDSLPAFAKGQEIVPDGTATVQRLANNGFRRVLNPMVNFLSRQPIAFAEFEKQWAHVLPMVEDGQLAEDEAMTLAMSRTVQDVIRNVHNIHDRTQWSATLRNWVPFYFAQEQAYRRFGRLLAENPAAFRRYELMIANVHDVGQVFQGPDGRGYFVMPGTGWMAPLAAHTANTLFGHVFGPVETSTPIGMGWNLGGMNVIFPLSDGIRPGLGPLVSVPVKAVEQFFPEMGAPAFKAQVTAGANAILGPIASSQDLLSQFIPNTIVQRLATAGGVIDQRSFMSTMMQTLQTLDYEGKIPAPGAGYMKWQQFIDRVKNQTRVMYTMKALVGAVTPVSPELTDTKYDKFSGELSQDVQATGSLTKGVQMFLSKNPDATPYTVFQSYSPTGATPPDSLQAENWINTHSDFISKYPYASFFFMPQLTDNKYNATVYNEQLAQGYRVKYDPEANPVGHVGSSFLAQLYIAAGNSYIYDDPNNYPTYQKAMNTLPEPQKYQAYLKWQAFLQGYGKQNPVWGEYYGSNTKAADRSQAIKEVQQIIAEGELPNPDSEQSKGIVGLMQDYAAYEGALQAGVQNGYATESKSAIDQAWYDHLTSVAQDHPELRVFINGLFHSLPDALPAASSTQSALTPNAAITPAAPAG